MTWLDNLSALQIALIFCVFFVGLAWFGTFAIHPYFRRVLHGDEPSNEVILWTAGNWGLVFAVLLGLLVIATFQTTKDLVDTIGRETSSLSTLYRTADGYPDPIRNELKSDLRDYTRYVVEKDWPAHRLGLLRMGGEHRLEVIRQKLLSFEPATKTQQLLQEEMLRYLNAMTVAREQRLSAVTARIPNVLWYIVMTGAIITFIFMWMMHMKAKSQFLLGGMTAFFLAIMTFLIFAMDRPLKGAVSVPAESFTSVYDLVMKWDE
jgi:hypothetical protein